MDRRRTTRVIIATVVVAVLVVAMTVASVRSFANRNLIWQAELELQDPHILATDRAVLVGHEDGLIVLGLLTGEVRVSLPGPRPIAATVIGRDFFVYQPGSVGRLDSDGEWVWRVDLSKGTEAVALDAANGRLLLAGSRDRSLSGLDLKDGTEVWSRETHLIIGWGPQSVGARPLHETHQVTAFFEAGGNQHIIDSVTGEVLDPTRSPFPVSVLDTVVDVADDCVVRLSGDGVVSSASWPSPRPKTDCDGAAGTGSTHWIRSADQLHALDVTKGRIVTLEGLPVDAFLYLHGAGEVLAVPRAAEAGSEPTVQLWRSDRGEVITELAIDPTRVVNGARGVLLIDDANPLLARLALLDPGTSSRYQVFEANGDRTNVGILEGRVRDAALTVDNVIVAFDNKVVMLDR